MRDGIKHSQRTTQLQLPRTGAVDRMISRVNLYADKCQIPRGYFWVYGVIKICMAIDSDPELLPHMKGLHKTVRAEWLRYRNALHARKGFMNVTEPQVTN